MEEENVTPAAVDSNGSKKGSKTVLVVVIAVIVLAAGAFAYFKFSGKSDGGVSGVISKALNSDCKYNDPDLCKFLNNWKSAGDMTMIFSTNAAGTTGQSTFKIDGENSEMINVSAGKEDYHTISIGSTTYTLDYADSKWWKYSPSASDASTSEVAETKELIDFDVEKDTTAYTKIGKEACGKLNCFKYQVVDQANAESAEFIYFDDKDYLLRKTRSEAKDGSISESTIEYGNVSVSVPSPVKEGSPYDSALNSTTPAGSSDAEAQAAAEEALRQLEAQQSADANSVDVPEE